MKNLNTNLTVSVREMSDFVAFTKFDLVTEMEYLMLIAFNKEASPMNRMRANQELVSLQKMLEYFVAAEEEDMDVDDISFYDLMIMAIGEEEVERMFSPTLGGTVAAGANKVKDYTKKKTSGVSEGLGKFFMALAGKPVEKE